MNPTLASLMSDLESSLRYQLDGLHAGMLSVDEWQAGVAQDLLVFHTSAYLAGLDSDTLDAAGRAAVVAMVQDQVDFLNAFADLIEQGGLSDAAIDARLLSYTGAINASWWQGATDGADLPFQPGDGGTPCLGNCRCEWQHDGTAWQWVAEPNCCAGCEDRAAGGPYGGTNDL